ncbi:glycosyltransferase [Candidatus Hydrogenedentota bacterium]
MSEDTSRTRKKKKLKIAYIASSLEVSGRTGQLCTLACDLASQGNRVSVICMGGDGPAGETLRDADISVKVLDYKPTSLGAVSRVCNALEGAAVNVAHSFLPGMDYFVCKGARKAEARVVIASRREIRTGRMFFQRLTKRVADHITANSKAARDYACRREGHRQLDTTVVYNSVDTKLFSPGAISTGLMQKLDLPSNDKIVLVPATLESTKGHDILIRAAERVVEEVPDAVFLLAGEGLERNNIESMIASAGLEGKARLLGFRDDMPDLYRAARLSVVTSHSEAFPNTLLESMACGTPVIGTRVGGISEVVRDRKDGYVVLPSEPQSLADSICQILLSDRTRESMSENACSRAVEAFSIRKMVDSYEELYRELIARSKE